MVVDFINTNFTGDGTDGGDASGQLDDFSVTKALMDLNAARESGLPAQRNVGLYSNYLKPEEIYSTDMALATPLTDSADYFPGYAYGGPVTQSGYSGKTFSAPTIAPTGNIFPFAAADKQLAEMRYAAAAKKKTPDIDWSVAGTLNPDIDADFRDMWIKSYKDLYDNTVEKYGGNSNEALKYLASAPGKLEMAALRNKFMGAKRKLDDSYSYLRDVDAILRGEGKTVTDIKDGKTVTTGYTVNERFIPKETADAAIRFKTNQGKYLEQGLDGLDKMMADVQGLYTAVGVDKVTDEMTDQMKNHVFENQMDKAVYLTGTNQGRTTQYGLQLLNGWIYQDIKDDKGKVVGKMFSDDFMDMVKRKYDDAYGFLIREGKEAPDFQDFISTVLHKLEVGQKMITVNETYDNTIANEKAKKELETATITPVEEETIYVNVLGQSIPVKVKNYVSYNDKQQYGVDDVFTYTLNEQGFKKGTSSRSGKIVAKGEAVNPYNPSQVIPVAIFVEQQKVGKYDKGSGTSTGYTQNDYSVVPMHAISSADQYNQQKKNFRIDYSKKSKGQENLNTNAKTSSGQNININIKEGKVVPSPETTPSTPMDAPYGKVVKQNGVTFVWDSDIKEYVVK